MKPGKAETFFSNADKDKIKGAIAAAEINTTGEIATMVVDASDSYREAHLIGVMFLAGLLSLIVCIATRHVTIWSYLPLAIVFAVPCHFLLWRFPRLKLSFVARKRLNEAVRERALRAFYEKGLYRTINETGVLIFISLLEHKIWVLGDRGINEKIRPESWQDLAATLAMGIRQGNACESLCQVISSCGKELARHFPQKLGLDVNELADDIIL